MWLVLNSVMGSVKYFLPVNFWIFFGKLVKFGKFPTDKNYNKWIWQWCPLSWCWPVCGKMNHKNASKYVLGLNFWFLRPEWTLNEETLREILKLVTSVNLPVKILLPVEHPFPNYRFTTELNWPLHVTRWTWGDHTLPDGPGVTIPDHNCHFKKILFLGRRPAHFCVFLLAK